MKKIKTYLALILAGIAAITTPILLTAFTVATPVAVTGCAGLSGTNSAAAISAAALILQNSARAGAIAAITPPTGNTNNAAYFTLAAQGIGAFLTGTNYSPAALQTALIAVKVPEATNVWVQLGIGAVIDLYEVYFIQYVNGQVGGNAAASQFLSAIQSGFNQALNYPTATPITPPALPQLKRSAISQDVTTDILPRPLKK